MTQYEKAIEAKKNLTGAEDYLQGCRLHSGGLKLLETEKIENRSQGELKVSFSFSRDAPGNVISTMYEILEKFLRDNQENLKGKILESFGQRYKDAQYRARKEASEALGTPYDPNKTY